MKQHLAITVLLVLECPSGWYGLSCANVCLCHNGAQCHHVTGACTCASGFQGNLCDIPCSGTTWGVDCLKVSRYSSLHNFAVVATAAKYWYVFGYC